CPFVFDIGSLIPKADSENIDDTIKQLSQVILRYLGDIRKIYQYYTQMGRGSDDLQHAAAISRVQIWKLLKDCKIKAKGHLLTDMDRACAMPFKNDPCFRSRYTDPHAVNETFILHDFIDALIRIAHLAYGGRKDLSIHEHGLAASFSFFMKNDILPNARGTEKDLARGKLKLLEDSLFQDYGILPDSDPSLTISRVLHIFSSELPAVSDGGCYCLEFELVPYEVFDALFKCFIIRQLVTLKESIIPVLDDGAAAESAAELMTQNQAARMPAAPLLVSGPSVKLSRHAEREREKESQEKKMAHLGKSPEGGQPQARKEKAKLDGEANGKEKDSAPTKERPEKERDPAKDPALVDTSGPNEADGSTEPSTPPDPDPIPEGPTEASEPPIDPEIRVANSVSQLRTNLREAFEDVPPRDRDLPFVGAAPCFVWDRDEISDKPC
ncbi:hypothetical protein BDK51DRAFT_35392, partial [Blyttiomyces helicus]